MTPISRWLDGLNGSTWDPAVADVFGDWSEEQGLKALAEKLHEDAKRDQCSPALRKLLGYLSACVGSAHAIEKKYVHETPFGRALREARESRKWSFENVIENFTRLHNNSASTHWDAMHALTASRLSQWERGPTRPTRRIRNLLVALLPELAHVDQDVFENHGLRSRDRSASPTAMPPLVVQERPVPNAPEFVRIDVKQIFKTVTRTTQIICARDELEQVRTWIARRKVVSGVQLPVGEYYFNTSYLRDERMTLVAAEYFFDRLPAHVRRMRGDHRRTLYWEDVEAEFRDE